MDDVKVAFVLEPAGADGVFVFGMVLWELVENWLVTDVALDWVLDLSCWDERLMIGTVPREVGVFDGWEDVKPGLLAGDILCKDELLLIETVEPVDWEVTDDLVDFVIVPVE